jgi:uncharacterized membrane protein YdbT with pleckstrin-like domain
MIKQVILSAFMAINLMMLLFWDATKGVEILGYNVRLLIALSIPLVFFPVVTAQLRRISTHYVITEKNLWAKRKIFARNVDPTVLSRVQDCRYEQSYIDRIVNKGDVYVETAGTGGTDVVLRDVPHPSRAAKLIRERITEGESRRAASPL